MQAVLLALRFALPPPRVIISRGQIAMNLHESWNVDVDG
jgi:hypothetical protein